MPPKKVKSSSKRGRPKPRLRPSRSGDVVKAPSSTYVSETNPGTGITQLKVLTNHPYENENIYFPLKIGGIIILFSSLFFLLFTYVDPLRNFIVKIKEHIFPKGGGDVNEGKFGDKSEEEEDEDKEEKERLYARKTREVAQRKLDVVREYVDSTGRPSSASGGGEEIKSYCYVGEDDGLRTCIPISDADKCMSGDIFTSEKVCVNPNLRHYEPEEGEGEE
jgi:hypothetical protein